VTFWSVAKTSRAGTNRSLHAAGSESRVAGPCTSCPKASSSPAASRVHCRRRAAYLRRCRALLGASNPTHSIVRNTRRAAPAAIACPRCQTPMECISHVERPGWTRSSRPQRPWWYDPSATRPPGVVAVTHVRWIVHGSVPAHVVSPCSGWPCKRRQATGLVSRRNEPLPPSMQHSRHTWGALATCNRLPQPFPAAERLRATFDIN